MTNFTTRVELHDANGADYQNLHAAMQAEGFSRTIVSENGTRYHLPTAEYNFVGPLTRAEVLAKARAAAAKVRKSFEVLVTESAGRTWHNLRPV